MKEALAQSVATRVGSSAVLLKRFFKALFLFLEAAPWGFVV